VSPSAQTDARRAVIVEVDDPRSSCTPEEAPMVNHVATEANWPTALQSLERAEDH
jgi:hypothetical protein